MFSHMHGLDDECRLPSRLGGVELRPVVPEDSEFLYRVYAGTRQEELAPLEWTHEQKEAFLRMQFTAQSRHYASEYPAAEFQVILVEGRPAGRLYLHRRPQEIRVMDIALLPEFRGRGTGTRLMKAILAEGDEACSMVSIHVETFNPARHWYERLGFRPVASNDVYLLMERPPATVSAQEVVQQPHSQSTP